MQKYMLMLILSVGAVNEASTVPSIQLVNKTGNKTGYPSQTMYVEVILGFDKSIYSSVQLIPFASLPLKVPGIPGTFTLRYTRGDLMANTEIQVPVVEGTRLIFYDDSYQIVQPK